jgi:hypothetical protein
LAGGSSPRFVEGLSPSGALADGAHEPVGDRIDVGVARPHRFEGTPNGLGVGCRNPERRQHPVALVMRMVCEGLAGPLSRDEDPVARESKGFPLCALPSQ